MFFSGGGGFPFGFGGQGDDDGINFIALLKIKMTLWDIMVMAVANKRRR